MNSIKNRPWIAFSVVSMAAIALTYGEWHSMGTVLAELLIAAVIYYEVEETRIAAFLKDALGKPYEERRTVYEAFTKMEGATLKEKASAFTKHLWKNRDLRAICDFQLTYFSQAHFLVRGSLFHRKLVSEWFPQVTVRVWAMLSDYAKDSERLAIRAARELAADVVDSVGVLNKTGITTLAIHSELGERIEISAAEIAEIGRSASDYLGRSGATADE